MFALGRFYHVPCGLAPSQHRLRTLGIANFDTPPKYKGTVRKQEGYRSIPEGDVMIQICQGYLGHINMAYDRPRPDKQKLPFIGEF